MKKMKRYIALMLCLLMVCTTSLEAFADEISVQETTEDMVSQESQETSLCELCQQKPCVCEEESEPETQSETEPAVVMKSTPATLYQILLAAESVEDMYMMVLEAMNSTPDNLRALTAEEIDELRNLINELDPEGDDVDTEDLLMTLSILPNGGEKLEGDPTVLPDGSVFNVKAGTVPAGTYYLNTNFDTTGTLNIGSNVVIDLNGYVLRGNGKDAVINVTKNGRLTIKDSRPTLGHHGNVHEDGMWRWEEGNAPLYGGIIYNRATAVGIIVGNGGRCTIEEGKIAGCYSTTGAAITVDSASSLVMTGGKILYNKTQATKAGASSGVIHGEPSHGSNTGSTITLSNVTIQNNIGNYSGGAIYGYDITLNNCTITDNKAENTGKTTYGGAIYVNQGDSSAETTGKLVVQNCIIKNNTATHGGAIYGTRNTEITISGNTEITNNRASSSGGGIYAAKLIVTGTSAQPVKISGNQATANGGGIYINSSYVVKENDKNVTKYDLTSCTINYCTIEKNEAGTSGGGIYTYMSNTTISNSAIKKNRAVTTETFDNNTVKEKVNKGRGGGFYFDGREGYTAPECKLTNVDVSENVSMYYGGGGQVSSYAKLELISGRISNNISILHGAGGLHVTGDAQFTLTGGEISSNVAHSVGGGIHSSYSCVLNLNGGEIKDNIVYGRGAGVHVNVGGNLQLKGTKISGNKAYSGTDRLGAEVIALTDSNWPGIINIIDDGSVVKGYGGGVVVDAGTCTMTAGELSGNWAQVGGGGIAFVMINASSGTRFGENKVVNFNLIDGSIYGNTTDGDGAGVYLMKNSFSADKMAQVNEWTYEWSGNLISKILNSEGEEVILKDANGDTVSINDILSAIPYVNISGGKIFGNTANKNGGAAYLEENSIFEIGGGEVYNNSAINGGAVYVAQGTATISGGTMKGNIASGNGGALYITGDVTMIGGLIGGTLDTDANKAANGGALYVADGNIKIEHGVLKGNKAIGSTETTGQGGAIYMAGDANTTLTMESGEMSSNTAANDGGAVFATNGKIYIGLLNCSGGEDHSLHVARGAGRHHPRITNNTAEDTGGAICIANEGTVYFYCGLATGNQALYKGVGHNVFMNGGEFYLYDGANVGSDTDPDLVIIGGVLHDNSANRGYIDILYYQDNKSTDANAFEGKGENGVYINLPDGEYFWDPAENYRFFGWTPMGSESAFGSEYVRNKGQYLSSGESIQITDTEELGEAQGTYDGTEDETMHLYALWAPETSVITYVDGLNNTVVPSHTPATYSIDEQSYTINVGQISKPGYIVVGWYIYQDEGMNANWGYEPIYKDNSSKEYSNLDLDAMEEKGQYLPVNSEGVLELNVPSMTFGNITLIAKFEAQYSSLTITKEYPSDVDYSVDENQSFIFQISGTPYNSSLEAVDIQIVIHGEGSKTIEELPVGTYAVKELTDWSWRYDVTEVTGTAGALTVNENTKVGTIKVEDPSVEYDICFTNAREENSQWLSGDSYCTNWWQIVESTLRQIVSYCTPE